VECVLFCKFTGWLGGHGQAAQFLCARIAAVLESLCVGGCMYIGCGTLPHVITYFISESVI
jgi:hypothetical protein